MFTKNSLTKIIKSFLITTDVTCSELGNFTRRYVNKVAMLCAISSYCSPAGGFLRFQKSNQKNQYELTTTNSRQQKTSCEKPVNKTQIKYIKQIISNILGFVKSKIALPKFAENKPKKRDFTLEDLTLIQNLVEKNNGDFPKSWAQFYKLTGTNPETFNN